MMVTKIISTISIVAGLFLGFALLSGSSISCGTGYYTTWFSAPTVLSNTLISAIVPISITLLTYKALVRIFKAKE